MGSWGTGLYSGDLAADLRSTIAAVARLPFDPDRLVEVVCEVYPDSSGNPDDEEYTVFWLVLADLFSKRGLDSARVRDAALEIIDSGKDLAAHESLGMTPADLRKRKRVLEQLRASLVAPLVASKPRKTLKSPQPLLMQVGDILIYPTSKGESLNPYFRDDELDKLDWKHDGWGAMLIIDAGRAFDFLAWYRPLTLVDSLPERPDLNSLLAQVEWVQRFPGSCSARHFQRMRLENIHHLAIDESKRRQCFPELTPGIEAAVKDISISNELSVGPNRGHFYHWRKLPDGDYGKVPYATISCVAEITVDSD